MSETVEIRFKRNDSVAIVDAIDADLAALKWTLHVKGYAFRPFFKADGKKTTILLHRIILSRVIGRELVKGEVVDHIDGNPANNTRANLRLADQTRNMQNSRVSLKSKSGYKGVTRSGNKGYWNSDIRVNGVSIHLGAFEWACQAAKAYNDAAKKHFGEFARLNEIWEEDRLDDLPPIRLYHRRAARR